MANKQVIKASKISDIDVDKINIGLKKINKRVPITLNDTSLVFQTPFLEVTGSIEKTTVQNIFQLITLFKGESKHRVGRFRKFIETLETHISRQITQNGSKWFTQEDVIIKSLIREPDNQKTEFVKWVFEMKPNMFIDEQKKPIIPDDLKNGDQIKLIVELSDLWINENQCGFVINVQKILVKPHIEKMESEYVFNDTDTDGENSFDENENDSNIVSLLATEQKSKNNSTQQYQNKSIPQQYQEKQPIQNRQSIQNRAPNQFNQQYSHYSQTNTNDDNKKNNLKKTIKNSSNSNLEWNEPRSKSGTTSNVRNQSANDKNQSTNDRNQSTNDRKITSSKPKLETDDKVFSEDSDSQYQEYQKPRRHNNRRINNTKGEDISFEDDDLDIEFN